MTSTKDSELPSQPAKIAAVPRVVSLPSAAVGEDSPRSDLGSLEKFSRVVAIEVVRRRALGRISSAREPDDGTNQDDEMLVVKTRGCGLDARNLAELHRALGIQAVNCVRAATNSQEARDELERLAKERPYLFSGLPPGVHPYDWQREVQTGELDESSMSFN